MNGIEKEIKLSFTAEGDHHIQGTRFGDYEIEILISSEDELKSAQLNIKEYGKEIPYKDDEGNVIYSNWEIEEMTCIDLNTNQLRVIAQTLIESANFLDFYNKPIKGEN